MLVEGRYMIEFLLYIFLQILGYWFGSGDFPDTLRSTLAQAQYAYRICEWDAKGVPFRLHAYVPECDPVMKEDFHEREDHGHLLKVINKIKYNFKYS